jgi:hypothetical protein
MEHFHSFLLNKDGFTHLGDFLTYEEMDAFLVNRPQEEDAAYVNDVTPCVCEAYNDCSWYQRCNHG